MKLGSARFSGNEIDPARVVMVAGVLAIAAIGPLLGMRVVFVFALVGIGLPLILVHPEWGVAMLMTTLLVQYGSRATPRFGISQVTALLPAGVGFLTPNNVLGVVLAVLMAYRVYRDGDWSFTRNRALQLIALISLVAVISTLVNGYDAEEQRALGLRPSSQHPIQILLTRASFFIFFVAFVRSPRQLRAIVMVFAVLALITAWSGTSAALGGGAYLPHTPGYRAGGRTTLMEAASNPNRLAMISTLTLVFFWEFSQSSSGRRWIWLTTPIVMLLVLTVFLTASRGGMIGLLTTSLLLFLRRRGAGFRLLYGAVAAIGAAAIVVQFVPAPNWQRLGDLPGVTSDEASVHGSVLRRQYTFSIGSKIVARNRLIGVGLGNWRLTRFKMDPLRSVGAPHNSYLLALAEGGVIKLALYLLLFGYAIRRLGEVERDPEAMELARLEGADWLIHASRICVLSFLVFSLFADLWELVFFYLLMGIAAVLIYLYTPLPPAEEPPAYA